MSRLKRSSSASDRRVEERSSSAATACSVEPSKKVWQEHVSLAILFVAEMPLVLEDAQQRADRRIAGRIGELIEHLGCGRATHAIDHVHDLAFPTAELRVRFFGHCQPPNRLMLKN